MIHQIPKTLGLGIDTGGTFTDSVIVDLAGGEVISKAKAPTTRDDLKRGVAGSLNGLDRSLFSRVGLVSLSTTLATNSIVEGKGSRVALLATVPRPETFSFSIKMPADEVAVIAGAHDTRGNCSVELDMTAAMAAVRRLAGEMDAFAVSGYFSIYNAEHELRLKEMIRAETGLPVVCGHELSGAVGLVERAVTASLNARLLPVIRELLDAVGEMLQASSIDAPLMVVRGDGSLISAASAQSRPVETVLSGPAASVAGACKLSGLQDAIVVDMGGTTTDIGVVTNGQVSTATAGAVVGGWQTRVHAVEMWTVGLGGDSKIRHNGSGGFEIGPRRAIPICVAASVDGALLETLDLLQEKPMDSVAGAGLDIYSLVRRPAFALSKHETKLFDLLERRMLHRSQLDQEVGPFVAIERFVELGYVAEVAFTPTDLMHARGAFRKWDRLASIRGACVLARQAGIPVEDMLEQLHRQIGSSLSLHLASKALHEEPEVASSWSAAEQAFLGRLLGLSGTNGVSASITLSKPVVAVGAPVQCLVPEAVRALGARLCIPEHAEVANAFGAVTGRVVEKVEVHVRPAKPEGFVVAAFDVHRAFDFLEEAVAFAEEHARGIAKECAESRGGKDVVVTVERREESHPLQVGWGDRVLMEVKVTAIAVGNPA